jgi:hypothetical protein
VSDSNGNGDSAHDNGDARNGNGHDSDDRAAIARAVKKALDRADELAEIEAGGSLGRICTPLLAGPQRYRDPKIWAPNYRLLALAGYSDEEIERLENTPLHEDEHYRRVAQATGRAAIELGFPGAPKE